MKPGDQKADGFEKAREGYEQAWRVWVADSSKSNFDKAKRAVRRAVDNSISDETKQKECETKYDAMNMDDPDPKIVAVAREYFVQTQYNKDALMFSVPNMMLLSQDAPLMESLLRTVTMKQNRNFKPSSPLPASVVNTRRSLRPHMMPLGTNWMMTSSIRLV